MNIKFTEMNKFIIFLFCLFFGFSKAEGQNCEMNDNNIRYIETHEDGFVSTEQDAISIARIILERIYGEKIVKMEFICILKEDNIWYVKGVLPKNVIGGVPYIKIRKKDGKIMGYAHTK